MTHTETEIARLIERFADESTTATPTTPAMPREAAVTAPQSGYRVLIGGMSHDVEASGYGAAVLAAMPVIGASLPNVGGYVFRWDVSVTDSYGVTVSDRELSGLIQDARIKAQRP